MKYLRAIFLFCALLLVVSESRADHRNYVWTYEYMLMEPGEAEFEQYTTFKTIDSDDFGSTTITELNMEFEIGMNEWYDFAIYQNFAQTPGGELRYTGFKLRNRFKFGEEGQYFLDPLLYVEYAGVPGFDEHKIETKFILAKQLGKFDFSLNPYFELEYEDEEWEFEPEYALGFGYQFAGLLHLGIEAKGSESAHYIGPTISHGEEDLWFAFGPLFSLGDPEEGSPDTQMRLIFGIVL